MYNSLGIAHVPLVYTLRRSFSKVEARLGNNLEMQTATINTPQFQNGENVTGKDGMIDDDGVEERQSTQIVVNKISS